MLTLPQSKKELETRNQHLKSMQNLYNHLNPYKDGTKQAKADKEKQELANFRALLGNKQRGFKWL